MRAMPDRESALQLENYSRQLQYSSWRGGPSQGPDLQVTPGPSGCAVHRQGSHESELEDETPEYSQHCRLEHNTLAGWLIRHSEARLTCNG